MAKPISLILLFFFSFSLFATEYGSLLTTQEEATHLTQNTDTKNAIMSAKEAYSSELDLYHQGSISFDELQKKYEVIYPGLLTEIKTSISKDTTGTISPIQSDYDPSQESAYEAHIEKLIGLAQETLGIPAYLCLLPPIDSIQNLLVNGDFSQETTGWTVKKASAQVNSPDPHDITSPVYNKNSISFSNFEDEYVTVEQTINNLTPGNVYLVGVYLIGTPPAKAGGPYSGGISLNGATFLKSTITGKTTPFPQNSNEIDEKGLHRRFFWVKASGNSMDVILNGGPQTIFKYAVVVDITEQSDYMAYAESIFPLVATRGPSEVGHYPQVMHTLTSGENLLDGAISFQDNVDQSALHNGGHPYWYIGYPDPRYPETKNNKDIKFVNAAKGEHGLFMPSSSGITTNGPVPCPKGDYTLSMQVYVPSGAKANGKLTFTGTTLNDGEKIYGTSQTFSSLPVDTVSTVTLDVSVDKFFRPAALITNLGDAVYVYGVTLVPKDPTVYDAINAINPYNTGRSWYSQGGTFSYDFSSAPISQDWGIVLSTSSMFSPPTDPTEYTQATNDGILIKSTRKEKDDSFTGGGIQSTQLICPSKDFKITMSFTASNQQTTYEPTIALWTYGQIQPGPENPFYHTNGPGASAITEFDCEMGSDASQNTPPPPQYVLIRDGSYIGNAFGGQSEYVPPNWKQVPNFWDEKPHTATLQGSYQNGRLILTRSLDGQVYSTQDVGEGPFAPTYIRIQTGNNDNWNTCANQKGEAQVVIHSIDIETTKMDSQPISVSDVDYTWFIPGGGGSCAYTPFEQ